MFRLDPKRAFDNLLRLYSDVPLQAPVPSAAEVGISNQIGNSNQVGIGPSMPTLPTGAAEIAGHVRALLTAAGVSTNPPPQVFYKDRNGMLMVRAKPEDLEAIESVVEQLNGTQTVARDGKTEELITRVFKVDPRTFMEGLKNVAGLDITEFSVGDEKQTGLPNQIGIGSGLPVARTNAVSKPAEMVRKFFKAAGVEMDPPKQVFFNDRNGVLMVQATAKDMQIIEAAVEILTVTPPMVTIEARWVEITVDPDDPDAMAALRKRVAEIAPNLDLSRVTGPLQGQNLPLVNPFTSNLIDQGIITNAPPSDRVSGILSPEQFRAAIQLF